MKPDSKPEGLTVESAVSRHERRDVGGWRGGIGRWASGRCSVVRRAIVRCGVSEPEWLQTSACCRLVVDDGVRSRLLVAYEVRRGSESGM